MAFLFAKRLPDFFQLLGAVFRLFPHILTDKNGGFGLGGQDDAIARARVDFDDLRMNLVLGLKDDSGKVGIAAQRIDHNALDLDIEGVENIAD